MPDDAQVDPSRTIAELRRELDTRTAERDEALEQQTAAAEVLQVINASPGDLGLIFETLLGTGARLCKAEQAVITLRNPQDGLYHYGALFGYGRDFKDLLIRNPVAAGRASLIGRTALEGRVVHIEDAAADPEYNWPEALRLGRWHTGLGVPLLRDGAVVGTLALTRRRIERFTNKQIELIKTFADQAVIAIDNARLLGELRESEERYGLVSKAVAEGIYEWDVEHNSLWVSSRLIEIFGFQGRNLTAADWNDLIHPEDFSKYRTALRDCFKGIAARLDCEYRVRHSDGQYRWIEDRGIPVRNASGRAVRLVGAVSDISARKAADEALREALEQQTATAEVLQVINSSPGDLAPVFDAILEKAHSLCSAPCGSLQIVDGGQFRAVATRGLTDANAAILRRGVRPHGLDPNAVVQFDFAERLAQDPVNQNARVAVEIEKLHTVLFVPLLKDGVLIGRIAAGRQEVRPFTDKQIALLQNFAAQAVIAMENARLLTETRESIEQQTATAEVLQVINSSHGDLAPVFDAMLEKAMRLCEAAFGTMASVAGEQFHIVAQRGVPAKLAEYLREPFRAVPGTAIGQFSAGEEFLNITDLNADPGSLLGTPRRRAYAELGGGRSILAVPLRKDGTLLGALTLYRQEVRPFTDKQSALLQNFAAQAVIAMENARLLTETREALEQQTATAEVLQVINSSPGDLKPVFDAMLEKALALCKASLGMLYRYEGEAIHPLAVLGTSGAAAELFEQPVAVEPESSVGRLARGETDIIHIPDVIDTETYRSGVPSRVKLVELTGARTALWVALRKDDVLQGVFVIYRQQVRPFTDKQIALLENFAAQAVIAIENARLLTETREALAQQTATAEVLQVINSSPGDLAPVFDAILEKAHTVCGAALGSLGIFEGDTWRAIVQRGYGEPLASTLRQGGRGSDNPLLQELIDGAPLVHIADLAQFDHPIGRANVAAGVRALLVVALRKEDAPLGTISIARREPRPFSDKEIALLKNFAAQAVIAMENARLLTETREALEQQTATAEVLQVINSSPGELTPVFDAMLERAMHLCEAAFGILWSYDGEHFHSAGMRGVSDAYADFAREPLRAGPETGLGRILRGDRLVHITDIRAEDVYRSGDKLRVATVELAGARTLLLVPLRKDDALLGAFAVYRQEVRPFTDKQIALLQNFAAQAVIAMENARLLTETRGPWSSRPRPPRYCRSSTPRPATSPQCSTRSWKRRSISASPPSA